METGYELRAVAAKGEGVFATRGFREGERIMLGRLKEVLEGNHSHAAQLAEDTWGLFHGIMHKINHSCDPNCGFRLNEEGGHDVVARADIAPGEELTVDYAMRNYAVEHFPRQCLCGTAKCRGTITGWRDLPAERKRDYSDYAVPYLMELDARDDSGAAREADHGL